jgi:aldehyde dehydrogenase (NAD+)
MLSRLALRVVPKVHPLVITRGYQTNLLIDGKWIKSASGKTFKTINPATEEAIADVQEADKADVDIAVEAATRAFYKGPWANTGGYERGRILNRVADLIEKHKEELAKLEVLDNGKAYFEAINADLPLVIQCYRYYAGWADKISGRVINPSGPIAGDSHFAYLNYEPVGVVGQIIPWNFPLLMQAWKLAPAFAAGCTVVLKPAEQTPLSALRIGELFQEAGLPDGVLNILPGFGPTAGSAIANHTKLDKIAFTGSTEVGLKILQSATTGGNLKRVTLELGGKSPNIILADSDIENAVKQSHVGVFLNQGQCCIAGTRMFVEEKIYPEVVERSTKLAKERRVGNPMDKDVKQGSQVDKEQFDKIMALIGKGKSEGARLTTGGNRVGQKGFFIEPTVFADVKDEMTIAQEEIFGPVMSIMPFKNLDEVVARANNTTYGLGASVFTKDIGKAHYLAQKIRAGTVYVNCYDVFDAATPFGGFKASGLGRELGNEGLHAYLEPKTVIMRTKF